MKAKAKTKKAAPREAALFFYGQLVLPMSNT
jgi:hypothetical protein